MLILGLLSSVYISYLILLAPGILRSKNTSEQLSRIMSLVILLALIWEIELLNSIPQKGTGLDLILMEGMYRINETTLILEIFLLILVLVILQLYAKEEIKSELYLILMTNLIGLLNLLESHDLIITITAWELINLSLYLLVTMGLYMKTQSLSAGLKYFLLSALTTGFLLMGISLIYSSTGTTNLDILWAILSLMEITSELKIGLLLLSVPLVLKLAAAPFHNWAPDLYDAIPTPIVLWIALIPKLGICILLLNLAPLLLIVSDFYYVVGIISVIIGSIALGSQWKIKRFLAYSAISHIGFLLLAYLSQNGISPSDFVGGAYINYLIIYMLTSLLIFIILLSINTSLDQQTAPSLKEFSGIFKKNPALGIALAISLFSLAGIPPLAGFFAKLLVLESILAESIALAIILILTSAISTANYLSVIKMSLFDLPIYTTPIRVTPIQAYLISGLFSLVLFYYLKPALYLSLLF